MLLVGTFDTCPRVSFIPLLAMLWRFDFIFLEKTHRQKKTQTFHTHLKKLYFAVIYSLLLLLLSFSFRFEGVSSHSRRPIRSGKDINMDSEVIQKVCFRERERDEREMRRRDARERKKDDMLP